MGSLLAMIKANLKMTVRNRSALFWNLVFPAIFIVLFGAIFGRQTVDVRVGVTGADGALRAATVASMDGNAAYRVTEDGDEGTELQALKDGERDVVLVFGPETPGQPAPVTMYYDNAAGPNAQVAISAVRQVLLTASQVENPVPIEEVGIAGADISFIDYFVPGILAMALMNSGVIGLSTAFTTYRERGILRRIRVTPFRLSSFVLARVISQLFVAVLQALILILLAKLLFGLDVAGNPLLVLLVVIVGGLAFLAIGFAISGMAKNTETAASYANLVTFPMLFLSGIFFSMDNAPSWLQPVTKVLPLPYLVDAMRQTMTHGRGFSAVRTDLAVLLATFVVAMVVAVRFFRWDARAA